MKRKTTTKYVLKMCKNERRQSQRLSVPLKVKYKWLRRKGILQEILTQDISGGGIRIYSETPFKKGDRLKARLYFPNAKKGIRVINEVMWCKKAKSKGKTYYDVGIKHLKIEPRDRERFVFCFCEILLNFLLFSQK